MKKLATAQKYILKIIHRKPLTFFSAELFNVFEVMDIRHLYVIQLLKKMHQGEIEIQQQAFKDRRKKYIAPRIYQRNFLMKGTKVCIVLQKSGHGTA